MSKKTIYTGYLHDVIEDTKYTYDDLKEKYGKELADNVQKLSENKEIQNYRERKEKFINRLNTYNNELILVELADKLQNLISDYHLFKIYGKDSLPTEGKDYEDTKWYYTKLKEIFNGRLENNQLLERYNNIYDKYFG